MPLTDSEKNYLNNNGADKQYFDKMLNSDGNNKIDSILIYKNGNIAFERYFNNYNRDKKHDIRSSTKAITALLVGIAIDKGFILDIDVPITTFFPEKQNLPSYNFV